MADFLPTDEPGIDDWFDNYGAKMTAHGASHGFSTEEIKQAQDDAVMVHDVVSGAAAIEVFRTEYIKFKRIMLYGAKNADTPAYPVFDVPTLPVLQIGMLAGIIQRMRSDVRRLKESKNYNEAVGADFRVLPAQSESISPDDAKPSLKGKAMADSEVDIYFTRGEFDGIELEMSRGANVNDWTKIGRFFRSPAEDDTPPVTPNTPEKRRYRARFLEGNKPVGQHSDIIEIVTTP